MGVILRYKMKYIILLLTALFIFSCGDTVTPKNVSTETIYPSDKAFLSNAADMRITVGTEAFWTLIDSSSQVIESKKYDFNDTKSYKLSEVSIEKYQIMEEILDINGETIARGLTNIINVDNLQSVYPIFLIPVNKAITLLSTEMGLESNIKNLEGHTVTKLPNGKILIWGGKDVNGYTSKVYVYSPEKLAVVSLNSNIARAYHTATLYYLDTSDKNNPKKPRVLISGGINNNGDIDTAEIFNPEDNSIEVIAAQTVSKGINQSTIVTQSGFIYLFGGKYFDSGVEKYSDTIVSFNTIAKTFSGLANLPKGLENTTATYIGGGKAIIAGGNDANTVSGEVYLFDSTTSEVSKIGNLSSPRTKHSAILYNGKVYLIGGFSNHSGTTFSSPIKDIDAATAVEVSHICDLEEARGEATVNRVNANTVIIAGGHNGDNTPIANSQIVELRKSSCMKSNKTISLNNPRYGAKSVLTSTGLTLIVGGISGDNDNSNSIMEVMTIIP
jgi:hypothetical protein